MKLIKIKFQLLFIIELGVILRQFTCKITENGNDKGAKQNEIIPDIDLRNFDIREKFYDCFNPGYDADIIVCLFYIKSYFTILFRKEQLVIKTGLFSLLYC